MSGGLVEAGGQPRALKQRVNVGYKNGNRPQLFLEVFNG
jgi:hypothetical protein